jgi:hypothetical protein
MAGKPKDLGTTGEARFQALVAQGWTAQAIADDLNANGVQVSRSKIGMRMKALRGPVAAPRAAAPSGFAQGLAESGGPPLPTVQSPSPPDADQLPTEADLEEAAKGGPEMIDEMLASFVREYRASPAGPVKQRWGALILKGNDDRRKLTPPDVPDPNDAPDMVRLGSEVEARFLKMVDMVLEER